MEYIGILAIIPVMLIVITLYRVFFLTDYSELHKVMKLHALMNPDAFMDNFEKIKAEYIRSRETVELLESLKSDIERDRAYAAFQDGQNAAYDFIRNLGLEDRG